MQSLAGTRTQAMSPRGVGRAIAKRTRAAVAAVALVTACGVPQAVTPRAEAGKLNVFSVEQEVELGRDAAGQVEQQLPVLTRPASAQRYVQSIVARLAPHAPGADYEYRARIINASDVNAFALPGGFLYVNRGLIEAVETEGQLAGVIAHEMAHIALRHGTQQASRGLIAQTGLELLSGLVRGGRNRDVVRGAGGMGAGVFLLRYSRDAETDADVAGARMMARAGYDPMDMARMFQILRANAGRDPGKVEQFLGDHPSPANRAVRIKQEARRLGGGKRHGASAQFRRVRADLGSLPPARSTRDLARPAAR